MACDVIMQIIIQYAVKAKPNESARVQLLDISKYKLILLILI